MQIEQTRLSQSSLTASPLADQDALKIMALAEDGNGSPKDWAALIAGLPAASCRILQIVNAAYAGLPGRMVSVPQAMVYLGFNTVKSIACALARLPTLPRQPGL